MKPVAGWYPVKLEQPQDGEITLSWKNLQDSDFNAPFFEDTLRRMTCRDSELRQTSLQELDELSLPDSVLPTAFVFHASRSGSTLLSQWFACLDGSRSLSEPPILDEILQFPQAEDEKIRLVRQIISTLGQRSSENDRYFFIKFDSWHLPWLPVIQAAFPRVPCFFIYRHPVEILWSHHRQRGSQMVPGLRDPALFSIAPDSFDPADLDGYATRVLEGFFFEALHHVELGDLIPLAYESLRQKDFTLLCHLGITTSPSEMDRLEARSRFHSKSPGETYQSEIEKNIPESIRIRLELYASQALMPMFEKLETITIFQT